MKTSHQFNAMTLQAMGSRLNIVSLPARIGSHSQQMHGWFYPELPEGWDFDTGFVATVLRNIAGEDVTVRYTSQSPYGLGVSVTAGEPGFILSASLNRKTSHTTVHNMLGKAFFATTQDYCESIAGLLNIFPAIGFTTTEIEASGKNIARLANMGFQVAAEDRQTLYEDLSKAIIRKTGTSSPHEYELKRNGSGLIERTLTEWDRDITLDDNKTARKILADVYARMIFDAENENQVERLVKFKKILSHDKQANTRAASSVQSDLTPA